MKSTDLSGIRRDSRLTHRRLTADYVGDALREAIHRGELRGGAVLKQSAIASRLGVSRLPVREALHQLHAEGLVEVRAHRPAVVRTLGVERIVEIYDLRALLEGFALERAMPHLDAAALREARTLLERMGAASDHARWLELNARFHTTLCAASGAAETLDLIEQLRGRGERYVRLWSGGSGIRRPDEAGREHAEILRLVSIGRVSAARRAMERHIGHTRDSLLAHGAPLAEAGGDAAALLLSRYGAIEAASRVFERKT